MRLPPQSSVYVMPVQWGNCNIAAYGHEVAEKFLESVEEVKFTGVIETWCVDADFNLSLAPYFPSKTYLFGFGLMNHLGEQIEDFNLYSSIGDKTAEKLKESNIDMDITRSEFGFLEEMEQHYLFVGTVSFENGKIVDIPDMQDSNFISAALQKKEKE